MRPHFFRGLYFCATRLRKKNTWRTEPKDIQYPTVQAAYQSIINQEGVVQRTRGQVTIFLKHRNKTVWRFTRPSHYAHPSVRKVTTSIRADGSIYLVLRFLCESRKQYCDRYYNDLKIGLTRRVDSLKKLKPQKYKWAPNVNVRNKALTTLKKLLISISKQQYRTAYNLLEPSIRTKILPKNYVHF
jgi:hypothetical protein